MQVSNADSEPLMADEEAKQVAYIPETILKKRKSNEEWALKRKAQLELRQKRAKQSQGNDFKLPEQFIKEYRDKVLTCKNLL